jgi:hypothetical protein
MTEAEWLWIRKRLVSTAKKRAKQKGLEFSITPEDILFPENGLCPILGVELKKHRGRMERNTPSLDRVNSELGYVPGNVRVVSWFANYCKAELTKEQLQKMADYANGRL